MRLKDYSNINFRGYFAQKYNKILSDERKEHANIYGLTYLRTIFYA